jgi:hypothetical protein
MIRGNETTLTLTPKAFQFLTASKSQLLKAAILRYQAAFFPFNTSEYAENAVCKSEILHNHYFFYHKHFINKYKGHKITFRIKTILDSVTITVQNTNEELQLGFNENYTLIVTEFECTIEAETVWGAMRG